MCEPWEELRSKGKHIVFKQNQQIGYRIDLVKVVAIAISYCDAMTRYNGILQCSEQVLKLCKEFTT